MNRQDVICKLRDLLASLLPADASAILFGSQARGDNSNDSDWDLLILLNHQDSIGVMDRGNYAFPLYEFGAEMGIDINPVIYTVKDWNKRSFTPFYKNVVSDGIRLWG